ncbi:hypothetical protein CHLRE_12g540250v5 [Chlamydomonas reinhardtii]|jgi:selT/selW/selH-like putative selenoprotein|nr:uncharacterized protein CHLRE_12g540250v5 [Chlamydomonas reinhardtii]PNW76295.1 hypothetical protein CHLRE_12g540250v5 [Chlamydomonas reinhardtii]
MKFPNADIKFSFEATPQATGFFEVEVNGELVHSKKNGGGHVDNQEKVERIFAKIGEALAK